MIDLIKETAIYILRQKPGPVLQFRLLRDVLKVDPNSTQLKEAETDLTESLPVRELASQQCSNGGWGAFHSRNTGSKGRISTTEAAVERALSLGLDASHPILENASSYILALMKGELPFPDRPEKNDRWLTGVRLFLASTLALIHPHHPLLDRDRNLWHQIAKETFQSGKYNPQHEIQAHAKGTGASVFGSYLVLNHRYQLNILGSVPGLLGIELEMALLEWLWELPAGIGYLGLPLYLPPPRKPRPIDSWFTSLEWIARLFPTWVYFAKPAVDWIWEQRGREGYWDFGLRSPSSRFFPLSENWRRRENRLLDWTTRVLILLRRYADGCIAARSLNIMRAGDVSGKGLYSYRD